MNVEAILNDLEVAEKARKEALLVYEEARDDRIYLIREAMAAGVSQAVLGRLLGVSRQRVHQLTEV